MILVRNVQTFAKAKSWYPVDAASRDNVTRQLKVKKRGGGNLPKARMNVICNRSYTKKREAEIGEESSTSNSLLASGHITQLGENQSR